MGLQRLNDVLNHFCRDAGTGAIMNQHKIRWFRQVSECFQPVPYAVVTFRAARNRGENIQPGKTFSQQGVVSNWQKHIHMWQESFCSAADDGFAP
ncbi:hypothetical protein AA3271_0115 [Gluconobacter japonicus NBRC 3271]|nr:hypothetical protein AA3271_0115 [Gluconobacter japonicus NBRC 3271]